MIELSIANGVAEIVLNAPRTLNALDEPAVLALQDAYDAAAAAATAGTVRALLLRGAGRAFCAGRDISGVDAAGDSDAARHYLADLLTPLLRSMAAFPAPTFAAAQGACLGVGLGLLIATDVVYVAEDARFGSPFGTLGATLDSGGHWFFLQRLGAHRTLDLIYSSELMSGADAVAAGLFSRVKAAGELLDFTRAAAEKAATGPTQAFHASKRLIAAIRDERLGLWDAVEHENAAQLALTHTADYTEGFAAFRAKRKPHFTGS